MKKGLPVSPGVAVAHAHCVNEALARHEPYHLDATALSGEVARFDRAVQSVAHELDDTITRVSRQVGEDEAAIFRAHRQLLRDPGLAQKVKTAIAERKVDAATALHETLDEYSALFQRIPDGYLQERIADLRDVVGRVLAQLAREDQRPASDVTEPVILVAPEVLPSQALTFDRRLVAGILTETGGATGHAAILARSLGIPAVSGLRGLMREVRSGDLIALDGREGAVYLNPGPEVVAAYRKLQREYTALCGQLIIDNADLPAVTADGAAVELLANVSGPADAELAGKVGASGVGLYRTEYLFLTHASVPDEEEQLAVYREVIESAPNKTVTIRTLDLGGDKHVPYLGTHKEANPFMGFRSIRLSSAYPEFFQAQLRAILRAGRTGRVSLLFPMISLLEEVQRIKKVVERTKLALTRAGTPFADLPIGIMIEVPAAALCIDELLDEVDFVSIGSNDLVQYLMAADRDNPHVAHLCEPFSPALLRLLVQVIRACNARGKPVTLCGEMAGWPRCLLPLVGAGLRRMSMSPSAVPTAKELIRRITLPVAESVARRALAMHTIGEVRGYLTRKVQDVWPNVKLFDMRR
jgi:phosphoenolpyruvate-protein phosphotransferase